MIRAPDASDPAGAADIVLALDTTAASCSVALALPDRTVWRARPMAHGHSRHLLGLVDEVLVEGGIEPDRIAAVGFGSGPGSFTGLRIACGIAQGLGFGWGRPLVAVDAMRTLALQAARAAPGDADRVLVALDLRMGEVCFAVFVLDPTLRAGQWVEPELAATLGHPDAARDAFERTAARRAVRAGDGFDVHPSLGRWADEGGACDAGAVQPDARAVASLARAGLRRGAAVDPEAAAPTYLRDKVALDVGEQAALRAARGRADPAAGRTAGGRR